MITQNKHALYMPTKQWRWMAKCSIHAAQDEERAVTNRRTTQRWCDKGQTSTNIAASFLYPRPPHDVARSPGTAEPYHADIERREQRV